MYREANTTTTRLTTEIIWCIAKTLLTEADELERLQDPTQTAHALTIQPTTSKTHLTNRNTETSAAHLAALGEPIGYDYDYGSECNEQDTNHRGA
jgi:23S rRNA-/tRNA-specific pseudouridylate synthase